MLPSWSPDSTLGNLLNQHSKFPAAIEAENCFPHPREGGIYEELYLRILRDNQEGTHLGQSRVLQEIVRNEKRVSLFFKLSSSESRADTPMKVRFALFWYLTRLVCTRGFLKVNSSLIVQLILKWRV